MRAIGFALSRGNAMSEFLSKFDGGELIGLVAVTGGILCGLVCGASAIYAAAAQILNEVYGRTVLPLGDIVVPHTQELRKAA